MAIVMITPKKLETCSIFVKATLTKKPPKSEHDNMFLFQIFVLLLKLPRTNISFTQLKYMDSQRLKDNV